MKQLFSTIFLLTLFLSSTIISYGQDEETTYAERPDETPKPSFWDRVYVGGNIGAQFGSVTLVNLSPTVGYMITPKISAGVGITYQYYSIRNYNYETHMYGGRIFGRYQPIRWLFFHAEAEAINWNCPKITVFNNNTYEVTTNRIWAPGLLVGGGLSQPLSDNVAISITALYNLLYNDCSPYNSPFVLRIGANFAL